MKNYKNYYSVNLLTILLLGLSVQNALCLLNPFDFDQEVFADSIYSSDIHTVMLHSASWEHSLPLIELNSDQQLELLFDDLSDRSRYFSYTLVHCDHQWQSSGLTRQQYLPGYGEDEILESHRSFNTTYHYVHYHLDFPAENTRPLISGNYVLVVYETDNPEQIVLTKRFFVVEKNVSVEATVKRPPPGPDYETKQLIQFSVLDSSHEIQDPNTELFAVIMQNARPDQSIILQKPLYLSPGKYDYTYTDKTLFDGGNEFRSLDIKSLQYQSAIISHIEFTRPHYHVFLKPDESRTFAPYFSNTDLNGSYYIEREESVDKHYEADYVYVHFSFSYPFSFKEEDIYVFGMLTNWSRNTQNRMTYNKETGNYELVLLLKQGWYDYQYVLKNTYDPTNNLNLEGNHFETTNSYSIFIYQRGLHQYSDRLIGFCTVEAP